MCKSYRGRYQGWHIGLRIYLHFLKYWFSLSVKVRTDKILVIGKKSTLAKYRIWINFGEFTPDVPVKDQYIVIF